MDILSAILLGIIVMMALVGVTLYLKMRNRPDLQYKAPTIDPASVQMQLQAYERLSLLVDRIALPNLISRLNQSGFSVREMQSLLTQSIKQEFDYNVTQQIYVSAEAWNAVKSLKDQNMLVVNQLANALPPHATGVDLNKLLLEFMMSDKKGNLHEVVSEVISFEAKKLL